MDTTFTAQEYFERGRMLLEEGQEAAAFEHFRTAHQIDPASPRYRSYYGLGLALVQRRFDRALELCRSASKEEFFNPELYHNLARVHLSFGFRAEGIRYLRRALMLEPAHEPTLAELRRLGVRLPPVLRFLPRRHLLNRWLGQLRSRIPSTTEPQRAPEGS
jgi:tetratricopeptide (TPR) repeat protein